MKKLITLLLSFLFIASASAQTTQIFANDANINFVGRIDFSDEYAPEFAYPGVSIQAKFEGTGVDLIMKDYSTGAATTTNYYNIFIDESLDTIMEVNSTDTLYSITSTLAAGEHTIEVFKRTEGSVGRSAFKGFLIHGGGIISPEALPELKIEFIGDSWTCGYGNELSLTSAQTNTGFHSENEDNWKAWGADLSRRLNGQYVCTAISGRGLYRNNTGSRDGIIPVEYKRTIQGRAGNWDYSQYIPHLIVINLGTNDLYPETLNSADLLDSANFVGMYKVFIDDLRSHYGNDTKIVCVFGNSKSDSWPPGLNHKTRLREYHTAVVDYYNGTGDDEVYLFEQATQAGPYYGEDWHPAAAEHTKMADEIESYLETLVASALSSQDIIKDSKVAIYPTVVDSHFTISLDASDLNWQVFDVFGHVVLSGTGNEANTESLKKGAYIVKIGVGNKFYTAKFQK
jgi:lysophospholipase L1-like esterase